jgi:hypothetical protein
MSYGDSMAIDFVLGYVGLLIRLLRVNVKYFQAHENESFQFETDIALSKQTTSVSSFTTKFTNFSRIMMTHDSLFRLSVFSIA